MKKCSKCKEVKSLTSYGNNIRRSDGKQSYCKSCQKKINRTYYKENKSKFLERNAIKREVLQNEINSYKQQKGCKYCSEKRFWCLEFHHPNSDKEFTVSQGVGRQSRTQIFREINKCEVVCRNCHADIHYKDR